MNSIREKFKHLSLTTKVVISTIVVGIVIGIISDYTANKSVQKVLHQQLNKQLAQQSQEDRLRFDIYMNAFRQTARVTVAQSKFQSYIESQDWFTGEPANAVVSEAPPSWFLSSAILRSLSTHRIAVLIDNSGIAREIYVQQETEVPPEIMTPGPLLIEKSLDQTHIAIIGEIAYMIASVSINNNEQEVTLMLASPIDEILLVQSQRDFPKRLVALLSAKNIIIASNNEQLLVPGKDIETYKEQYVVTERSFHDYGGSELAITFTSFVNKKDQDKIAATFSRNEKAHHLLAAILYTLSFVVIILWITGRIRKLTIKVDSFAKKTLGAKHQGSLSGDKLTALEERFKKLTKEVVESQEEIQLEMEQRAQNQLLLDRKERQLTLLETVTEAMDVGVMIFEDEKLQPINRTMKKFESMFEELNAFKLEGIESVERRIVDNKGAEHYFIITGDILQDDTKVIFARDITKRKAIFSEKERLQHELIQAQKMEAIGRLAGGIAHDFNNLLSAIIGYAELSMNKIPDEYKDIQKNLSVIREAGEKAATLTGQLLAFSRKQVMKMSILNLTELISNLTKMLMRLISENIEIDIHAKRTRNVQADPGQMEQVFINLAVNARDAMPDGGRIIIKLSEEKIQQSGHSQYTEIEPGEYVKVVVSDTGAGIQADLIKKIFDPFFTTKEVDKGTGLGLSTVYGIIKQHNGFIYTESIVNQGTDFTIFIPIYTGHVKIEEKNATPSELPTGTETVLIVEDDKNVRGLIKAILIPLGYKILEAKDGVQALQLNQKFKGKIDLMLTDVIMPGMNGRELYEKIKESQPELKTIFMSGYTDDVINKHGVLEPGFIFINKPLSPHTVAKVIREQLDA